MSFFKPKHITVRSIFLIVGGLVLFSSIAAAEQQRESEVITDMELLVLVFKLFFPEVSGRWVAAFSCRFTRGCQKRGADDADSLSDKWKDGS